MSTGNGFGAAGKHLTTDFGECVASRNTGSPEKKTSTKTVPYMSGFYDFSRVYGALAYESREVTYEIDLIGDDREDLQDRKSAIMAWLLGIHDEEITDDDIPGWHFVGSCQSADWEETEDGEGGTISVTFLCQPFIEADEDTEQTVAVGSGTVQNDGQTVNPMASTASGSATITLGGVMQSVSTTPQRLSGQLLPGSNAVTVTGSPVTLSWRKQRI